MKRLLCIVAVVVAALGTGAVATASQGAANRYPSSACRLRRAESARA